MMNIHRTFCRSIVYPYLPYVSDTLCFRTPPIFHRNNYFLDAQNMFFGHPLFSDTPIFHRNSYFLASENRVINSILNVVGRWPLLLKSRPPFNCNMQFHWKKIGLSCIMHIHENKSLPVKLATVRMECNGRKYCGWRRCGNTNDRPYNNGCYSICTSYKSIIIVFDVKS